MIATVIAMVITVVAHLLHVLGLRGGGIPAVVEDEDVWAGQTLVHLVEEELLLKKRHTGLYET